MVPKEPTATTVLASGAVAARRVFPCGRGFCQNQPGCAKDALVPRAAMPKNRIETLKRATFMASPHRNVLWHAGNATQNAVRITPCDGKTQRDRELLGAALIKHPVSYDFRI